MITILNLGNIALKWCYVQMLRDKCGNNALVHDLLNFACDGDVDMPEPGCDSDVTCLLAGRQFMLQTFEHMSSAQCTHHALL